MTQYKYDEIKSHFEDWIEEQNKQWITDNIDDLNHHCFNSDYYIAMSFMIIFPVISTLIIFVKFKPSKIATVNSKKDIISE